MEKNLGLGVAWRRLERQGRSGYRRNIEFNGEIRDITAKFSL
ncbi:hypothetical protein [Bacillus sp. KH172YL63]|nr:hypothetical protein [Bacillus sp. KH172YL63]BCB02394.1 hypothetical protein KH172YL63_05270 [Bacillus sp. KH172YL63]